MKCAKYKHTTARTDKILNVCKDCKTEIIMAWIEEQRKVLDKVKPEGEVNAELLQEQETKKDI
jgi:hypothetical protein